MSHRALVAEQQSNGRYNVYHSQNGADGIQLLDELRQSLTIHGIIDWDALTGVAIPELVHQISHDRSSEYTVEKNEPEHIVDPRPIVVNVREEEILLLRDLFEYEVLYVVEDDDVEAYWLTWTYPDIVRPLHRHVEIDVFEPTELPETADDFLSFANDREPLRTISKFEPGWLSDEVVRTVVKTAHRWIYELQSMSTRTIEQTSDDVAEEIPQMLSTPEYWIVFQTKETEPLVPRSYPFVVPIHIETPPNASSKRIRETAAQTRFSIGAGLNASQDVSKEDKCRASIDAFVEIVDSHAGQVTSRFMPGQMGTLIDEFLQTRDEQILRELWKN